MVSNTISVGSKRIRTFDILRGFFLAVILINHIELYPSLFDLFTGRGRLLVSAAEGFFFMSGLLIGMVYRRKIAQGFRFIFKKMWKRALQLYLGSVVLTLFFVWAALVTNHPSIKDGLFDVVGWPHIISQTLLMRYGFGWADFLSRFAILMFIAPFGFYLLAKNKWWLLLIISAAVWAFRGQGFTLAWQIIFFLGMAIGYYWNELAARWSSVKKPKQKRIVKSVLIASSITFALSYASVYILSVLNRDWASLPLWLQSFTFHWDSANTYVWLYSEKWTMGPVRILMFLLWFSALFIVTQRYERQITNYTRGVLELFGKNSLFVYIAHAFVVFAFKLVIPTGTKLWANFFITALALATLILLTRLYSKLQESKTRNKELKQTSSVKLNAETY